MTLRGECQVYDRVLTVFVAERDAASVPAGAFAHLERCDGCAERLQEIALANVALRRFGALPVADPSPDAWQRLRGHLDRSRATAAALAWRWRTTLAGLATGTLVVAAIVGPLALHLPIGATRSEPVGYSPQQIDLQSRRVEEIYLLAARSGTLAPLEAPVSSSTSVIPRRYPDAVQPERKEVASRSTGFAPTAD